MNKRRDREKNKKTEQNEEVKLCKYSDAIHIYQIIQTANNLLIFDFIFEFDIVFSSSSGLTVLFPSLLLSLSLSYSYSLSLSLSVFISYSIVSHALYLSPACLLQMQYLCLNANFVWEKIVWSGCPEIESNKIMREMPWLFSSFHYYVSESLLRSYLWLNNQLA